MKLLFTGGGGAGNEALWRHLEPRHSLFFGDVDTRAIDPLVPIERRLRLPWATDPAFVKTLFALSRAHEIDLIVPCVDEELPSLAEAQDRSPETPCWVSQASFVRTMLDKLSCAHALEAAELQAPQTRTAAQAESLRFPLLLKPRTGRGSRGVAIVSTPRQVAAYLELNQAHPEQILAQELLQGQEYTVCVLPDYDGRLRAVVPVRVLSKRGVTLRAHTEKVPAIEAYARGFQTAFRPTGPYNLQGMLGANGGFSVFEVNPRVSTTFCLAIAAGIEAPDLAYATKDKTPTLAPFREGVYLSRHWHNSIHDSQAPS